MKMKWEKNPLGARLQVEPGPTTLMFLAVYVKSMLITSAMFVKRFEDPTPYNGQ